MPLSPLLFVLVIETFLRKIRESPRIVGVPTPGNTRHGIKYAAYADDVTVFLTSEMGLMETLRLFGEYGRASGAKLNRAKTEEIGRAHV